MKKIMSTICASALLVLLFAQPALASSYSTYLKMSGGTYQYMSNNYRSFDGESLSMSMTLDTSGCMYSSNSDVKLKASLYRKKFLSRSYISYEKYTPGYNKKTWKNVGTGKYCWDFNKECKSEVDRLYYAVCESENVKMFN